MNHSGDPNLHSALELDKDVLNFPYLEEYLSSDVVGVHDGCNGGTGQLNFGFADDVAGQDNLLSFNLGARYGGNLGFPSDGQVASVGHPIDIPNFGGHRRSKNSPLTPPDSDGPDSPDGDQVFLSGSVPGMHAIVLPSLLLPDGGQQHSSILQHGSSQEFLSQSVSSVSSEPKRKRKRSSECSETLTTNGISSLRLGSLKSEPGDFCIDGSGSENLDSPDPLTTPATPDPENSYQCLKWLPFKPDECCIVYDDASQTIPPPLFRVDADKGFNYSFADEAFVCQKKNHLQVTAYMSLQSEQVPKYVRGEQNELRRIEKFCLHLYGIKMESQASRIGVEQSQADRSKRHYEPLQFHISPNEQAKITVGRLHFSETTANNMRKKGKPNPDQRYFLLVVAVYAHSKNKEYLVCANVSERIIVRASNPGQFENDMEVIWSRGQTTDSVFRMGRVGINTDKPEEALSVHGNLKVTGRLVHPSDSRVKESIEEVDTSEQLKNVSKMKLYRYRYSREYLEHAGLGTGDCDGEDTGVLAQEVKEVLPEAVKESDDLVLRDGKTIERFLVVNKERIFMENVGAVKELCKLTDNLEVRIDELETMNKKLQRRRCDTVSTFSSLSLSRCSSFRASIDSKKKNEERRRKKCHHHHHCHLHHHHCSCVRPQGVIYDEQGWCSPRSMQCLIVFLVILMILSIGGMAILYVLKLQDNEDGFISEGSANSRSQDTVTPSGGFKGLKTVPPSLNPTASTTLKPRESTVSSSRSTTNFLPTTNIVTPQHTEHSSTHKTSGRTSTKSFNDSMPRNEQTSRQEHDPLPRASFRQCCNQQSSEYPSEHLRGKKVYYEGHSISAGSPGAQLSDPELRILEDNYIIKCTNCSSQNSSHYIPFDPDLSFKPITLEINSTSSSLVLLCDKRYTYRCPEQSNRPKFDTTLKKDTWKKCHRWQLPVAYYSQSTYHFRLVFSDSLGNVTCQTTPQTGGPRMQDLFFYFIRKCKD